MRLTINYFSIILLIFFNIANVFSQNLSYTSDLLQGGIEDGSKLIKAYLTPLGKSIGSATNNGWFSSTMSDKNFKFYFNIKFAIVLIPSSDKEYDVEKLGLTKVIPSDANKTIAQTLFGEKTSIQLETKERVPSTSFPFSMKPLKTFNTVEGSGNGYLPLPFAQFGVSNYNINLTFRYLPKISISNDEAKLGIWGMGFQSNINHYIKPLKELPFDLSVNLAYTITNMLIKLELKPEPAHINMAKGPYDNQKLDMSFSALNTALYASKTYKSITFFGGIGYNYSKSDFNILGNYPIYVKDQTNTFGFSIMDVKDPIYFSSKHNEFKGDIGFQLDYKIMKFMSEFILAKYNTLNLSIGVVL